VKDRENKEERLRMAREADREEAVAALGTEVQDEILEDTRVTRSAISIDDKDDRAGSTWWLLEAGPRQYCQLLRARWNFYTLY
jgi:hypothetical protein